MVSRSLALVGLCAALAVVAFPEVRPVSAAPASAAKICPKCKRRYRAELNFCEQDGVRLVGPPQPVTDVRVSVANGVVVVAWKPVGEGNGFEIFRKAEGGPWQMLARVNANLTSFADTTAEPGGA